MMTLIRFVLNTIDKAFVFKMSHLFWLSSPLTLLDDYFVTYCDVKDQEDPYCLHHVTLFAIKESIGAVNTIIPNLRHFKV